MNAVALVLGLAAAGGVIGKEAGGRPLVQIDLTIYQGDPLGSKGAGTAHVLSRPRMVVVSGSPAKVRVGQDVPVTRPDGSKVVEQAGVQVELLPVALPGGAVWVELNGQLREVHFGLWVQAAGGPVPGFTEQAVRVAWVADPAKVVRHRIGSRGPAEQTWVEVAVQTWVEGAVRPAK